MNRPPEGRRARHNKPMIPVSQSKQQDTQPGEGHIAGPVEGTVIARRLLFRAVTTDRTWAMDMLIAIAAAKAMGAAQFEIAIDGVPQRPQKNGMGGGLFLFGGSPEEAETWRRSATEQGQCTVSIYAIVLEDDR